MTYYMDFLDVDRALDKRIVIGYTGSLPISEFSKKVKFHLQSGLHFGENELELSYFIPEELAELREMSIFIAQTKAQKHGNLYFVNYTLSSQLLFNALGAIRNDSHSTVLDSLVLKDGQYYLSLRFNRQDLRTISNAILTGSDQIPGLSISYLGENEGIDNFLNQLNETSKLVKFQWEIIVPEEHRLAEPFGVLGDEWVSEIRFMTKSNQVSEIFRTRNPLDDPERKGLHVISEKDNLYEYQFTSDNSFIRKYHAEAYDSRILRFGRLLHYKDGHLKVSSVVPKVQTDQLLKVLTACRDAFPAWDLTLSHIEEL